MKECEKINNTIKRFEKGKPFTATSLVGRGSYENVCQVLSRLVASGKLKRPTRGVYVRPKEVPYLGEVAASAEAVINTIAKQTGEVITTHGAEAARQLQLTTQAPVRPIFNTSGTTRELKIGKQTVSLKRISQRKQVEPGTMTCKVIAALWYLGKNHVNEGVVSKIKGKISEKQFNDLLKHTHRMPHWMAGFFEQYKK